MSNYHGEFDVPHHGSPEGPLESAWADYKFKAPLINPKNKRKYREKTEPEKPKVHYKNDLLTDAQREASDIASEYPLGILTGYVLWQYKKLRA